MSDTPTLPPTMRKKTVDIPGYGPTELFYGPGFLAISDLDGSANVIAQGYTQAELTEAFAQNRKPVPLDSHAEPLSGDKYLAFKAAHPELVLMVVEVSWEVLETQDPTPGAPPNFFAGSVPTFGPGADVPTGGG